MTGTRKPADRLADIREQIKERRTRVAVPCREGECLCHREEAHDVNAPNRFFAKRAKHAYIRNESIAVMATQPKAGPASERNPATKKPPRRIA